MNIPNEGMAPQQPPGAMPEGGGAPMPGQATDQNPILDAIATIAAYIAALNEKGDPIAPQLQSIMGQFVETIQQGAGAPAPGMMPPAQGPPQAPVQLNRAQAPGGGQGVNPMLSGMKGKNDMQGKVAVI